MWRLIRIVLLLLVLGMVAAQAWIDRATTTDWNDTLWIGIYPLNADGSATVDRYINSLTPQTFADIERFFAREAHRFGVEIEQPVHIELYPEGDKLPPSLAPGSSVLSTAWWSLKMRWFAWQAASVDGRAEPHIRVFVLYHDPAMTQSVPHSLGLQKGLIGVVHAFAERGAQGSNNVVIAHEVLHTLGATDKYDIATNAPLFPNGYADPQRSPRHPQSEAEIMAGRRALSETEFDMPSSLRDYVVGEATALEIRWIDP